MMTITTHTNLRWVPTREVDRVLAEVEDRHDRVRAFSALTRINTLYMVMRAGSGHIGSSFSACDIVSWMFLHQLERACEPDGDVYFSSKGHDAPGLYAALIGLGLLPEDLLHALRRIGGLPGHPDVRTPHIAANTGSLGMGISKAKGMVMANRMLGRRQRIYVMTGDGELQEGQNWEALASAAQRHMSELTVIVDHNKLQSDTWVADVSDLGDLEAKLAAFGWGVLRCDGHDFERLESTFAQRVARYPNQPVAIIADTIKGAGCATFASTSMTPGQWRYGFHSGAPEPVDYYAAHRELVGAAEATLDRCGVAALRLSSSEVQLVRRPRGERLPEVYGQALAEQAQRDSRIVALDADLVVDTGLAAFAQRLGERHIQCGIAEQDMVSLAGGLASRGLIPFVHSFSCFLHARPNEQIYNNATEGRRVIYVGSLAGVVPAGPGHSHQAVRDVSAVGAIPDLVVLEPCNAAEVRRAVDFCLQTTCSVYLRLVSVPCSREIAAVPAGPLAVGRGGVIRNGGGVIAIGSGPVVLGELLRVAALLQAEGIDMRVVNLPWLNRVDPSWLSALCDQASQLVVVENHYTRGGQADMLARALLELGLSQRLTFRGIGLAEVPECGTDEEALDAHGLSSRRLADAIRQQVDGDRAPRALDIVSCGRPD
jgi:transketolase